MKISKLILLLFLVIFSSCKEKEEAKEEVLRPVKYQVVEAGGNLKTRTFSGTAKAGDEIELSFRSGGVITEVNYWKGAEVKQGEVIAKLDNVEASLAYEQSVSALNSARSAMNTSKSNLDRVKSLYEKGSSSLSEYENAKNSYQQALDQFNSAKRSRDIQSTQLSYGIIKAPKDGLIAGTEGGVGERVSAGHVFAWFNAGKEMKIEVGLPENIVNKVNLGMKAKLAFPALENKPFDGTIIEMSPTIDAESSTYITTVGIDAPEEEIRPGMATEVTFDFDSSAEDEDTLIVPVKAVGEDGSGNFVFIIDSEDGKTGTVRKHAVEIGELTSDGFKIISGLEGGEKIATAGLQTLLDGQKVSLTN